MSYLSFNCRQFWTVCLQFADSSYSQFFIPHHFPTQTMFPMFPIQTMFPNMEDAEINSRLVGYCSDQVICMKMIIGLMIILAIDHLMINRATALTR